MKPLTRHTGRGVVLDRNDVDTDQIVPAEFCKRLTKSGYADALFAGWRQDPAFVLNLPAGAQASILVAGHNFGTGSSREHAVWALRDWGFVAVFASSFGDIFRRNAGKNGLLAVELPPSALAEVADRVRSDPRSEITVDLTRLEVRGAGTRHRFALDDRVRRLLMNGLDEIALTLGNEDAITAHEQARARWMPTTGPVSPASSAPPAAEGSPR
ncbi:3-isopropylmalate dehydratase small subunit [Streptomyces ziwulingensis]|uniref:3-isopropylmalate dehydratase small subunit n=1 Tax=Streptomyces ziwulingensis TaxID=1045501 RepID=A0ABP9D2E6_9ACTN